MHFDLALFLAILGIILIIPGGIVATMLTPKVQSWWAFSSRTRQVKRQSELRTRLQRLALLDNEDLARQRWRGVGWLGLSVYWMSTAGVGIAILRLSAIHESSWPFRVLRYPGLSERVQLWLVLLLCYGAVACALRAILTISKANIDSADKKWGKTKNELHKLDTLLGSSAPPQK